MRRPSKQFDEKTSYLKDEVPKILRQRLSVARFQEGHRVARGEVRVGLGDRADEEVIEGRREEGTD